MAVERIAKIVAADRENFARNVRSVVAQQSPLDPIVR
jgi:hypothetical protein